MTMYSAVMRGFIRNSQIATTTRAMSSQASLVRTSVNDKTGLAIVTMQRPPVCSINLELATELLKTFKDLERDKCRGAVLTSAMPSTFSAGLDILELHKPNLDRLRTFWTTLQDLWMTLYGSSYPTAAAINGHSPGGGCLLAISCEYRVMVRQEGQPYTIGQNEARLGFVPPQCILPRRLAESALTSGKLFTVDEALKFGLIDDIAKDNEEAVAKAEVWLAGLSRIPPGARKLTKLAIRSKALDALHKNKQSNLDYNVDYIISDRVQKPLSAYLESLKTKS